MSKSISLSFKGLNFITEVDEHVYDEIVNDSVKREKFSKDVYEYIQRKEITTEEQEIIVPDQQQESTIITIEPNQVSSVKWTHHLTKLLVDTRLNKEDEFNQPHCMKRKLWNQIASEISEMTDSLVTGDLCDSKYRNLLSTYRANKRKQTEGNEAAITWEFFEAFDQALGMKPVVVSTSSASTNRLSKQSYNSNDTSASFTKKRRRDAEISLNEYMCEKIKRQDEERRERETHQSYEHVRWQEMKELKLKKINAMYEIAKAINRLADNPPITWKVEQ